MILTARVAAGQDGGLFTELWSSVKDSRIAKIGGTVEHYGGICAELHGRLG